MNSNVEWLSIQGRQLATQGKLLYNNAKEYDQMDVAGQLEYHTIGNIYNLPDGQKAELIDILFPIR